MYHLELIKNIILFCITAYCSASDDAEKSENPRRQTTSGIIEGYFSKSGDFEAEIYEGVPFAEPPVGSLRFKSTSPVKSWDEVRNCGEGRSRRCIEFRSDKSKQQQTFEDCLYLDIVLPKTSNNTDGKGSIPIFVWIEGSAFQSHGKKRYQLSTIIKNFVPHQIIFIHINYRLGPLGFLSAGHHELQGNFGLDDQIEAIKWIRANADYFGGDKNRVILGGENAGAASSSILALSPKANGLFSAVIHIAGSILCPWAVRSAVTENNSARYVDYLGCAYNHTLGMSHTLKCMQSLPIDKLIKGWLYIATTSVVPQSYLMNHAHFTPVIDMYRIENSIIPSEPMSLLKNNAKLPVFIAVTDPVPLPDLAKFVYHGNHLNRVGELDFSKVISSYTYVNYKQIQKAAEYYYLGDYPRNIEAGEQKELLMRIASDQMYNAPAAKEAMIYSKKNVSVYTFVFNQVSGNLNEGKILNKEHEHDEYCNVTTSPNLKRSKRDNGFQAELNEQISVKIIDFIKRSFNDSDPVEYTYSRKTATKIGKQEKHKGDFYANITTFWYDTIPIIEMLDLEPQYRVIIQPCSMCDYPYKVPFYIMLAILVFVTVSTVTVFLHRQRVRLRTCYSMNGDLKGARDELGNS